MRGSKEQLIEMQQKWIQDTPVFAIDRIYCKGLLQEFADYEEESKATRIHKMCLAVGKFNLAEKIYIKYSLTEIHDLTVACGLALLASKNLKSKKRNGN